MTERPLRASILSFALVAALGCGPSAQEVRLQRENDELRKDHAQQRQYIADLRVRMQMAEARNRVLIDLVQGLTSNADRPQTAESMPAHHSLAALDEDLERLIASVQHSREDMEALRAQRKALSDELAQAKHTIEGARAEEAQMSARLSAFRALVAQLSPLIDRGDLEVRVVNNRMVLSLPESALFEPGHARITRGGQGVLDRVAEVLRSVVMREFQIGGHTDRAPLKPGKFQNNWQLSAARALEVMQYLSTRGISRRRLSAAAHADTQPIADESTPEGRTKNRRVEIVLQPNLEELPDLTALRTYLQRSGAGPDASGPPVPAATPDLGAPAAPKREPDNRPPAEDTPAPALHELHDNEPESKAEPPAAPPDGEPPAPDVPEPSSPNGSPSALPNARPSAPGAPEPSSPAT